MELDPFASYSRAQGVERSGRRFASLRREVSAIRVVEHQRAHAGFRIHHHALGEVHADVFGVEQSEEALLVVQVGAGRIAEAVTLAAVFRREAVVHGESRGVGEAPILANPPVQPLGRAFGG